MSPAKFHTAPPQAKPLRLQEYGVGLFEYAPTKSAWKKVLKKGWVTVDGETATSATYISGGELIRLRVREPIVPGKKLIFPLRVIYEDEHLAAIHKPGGILVSGNGFKTIANALVQNLKPSNLPDATQPQPVHRLDYATTGILLVGKTSASIRALNKLFEDRKVEKSYRAIAIGEMEASGEITSEVDGKQSRSVFRVIDTAVSERFGQLNLLELEPKTGRRHQLRVHLASQGNPILGDKDYGVEGLILKGKGLYLHAHSLRFRHPFTGEEMQLMDELPGRFEKIFPGSTR